MTREDLKETIIDYVIDNYSLNKDRGVVAKHVDEWFNGRQQVKSVDLADVGGNEVELPCECLKHKTYFDDNGKPRCVRCNRRTWLAR